MWPKTNTPYIAISASYRRWTLLDSGSKFNYYGHGANGMIFVCREKGRARKVPFGGGQTPSAQLKKVADDELRAVKLAASSCWTQKYLPLPFRETPKGRILDAEGSDLTKSFFLMQYCFETKFIDCSDLSEMKFGSASSDDCDLIFKRFKRIGINHLVDSTVWVSPNNRISYILDFGLDPEVHDPQ